MTFYSAACNLEKYIEAAEECREVLHRRLTEVLDEGGASLRGFLEWTGIDRKVLYDIRSGRRPFPRHLLHAITKNGEPKPEKVPPPPIGEPFPEPVRQAAAKVLDYKLESEGYMNALRDELNRFYGSRGAKMELSRRLGISDSFCSQMLLGRRGLSDKMLERLKGASK